MLNTSLGTQGEKNRKKKRTYEYMYITK